MNSIEKEGWRVLILFGIQTMMTWTMYFENLNFECLQNEQHKKTKGANFITSRSARSALCNESTAIRCLPLHPHKSTCSTNLQHQQQLPCLPQLPLSPNSKTMLFPPVTCPAAVPRKDTAATFTIGVVIKSKDGPFVLYSQAPVTMPSAAEEPSENKGTATRLATADAEDGFEVVSHRRRRRRRRTGSGGDNVSGASTGTAQHRRVHRVSDEGFADDESEVLREMREKEIMEDIMAALWSKQQEEQEEDAKEAYARELEEQRAREADEEEEDGGFYLRKEMGEWNAANKFKNRGKLDRFKEPVFTKMLKWKPCSGSGTYHRRLIQAELSEAASLKQMTVREFELATDDDLCSSSSNNNNKNNKNSNNLHDAGVRSCKACKMLKPPTYFSARERIKTDGLTCTPCKLLAIRQKAEKARVALARERMNAIM